MSLDFDPLEFYKEEILSDKLHVKINTVHRLRLICAVLSPTLIEKDLIPFLIESVNTFEDEVLFALSHELSFLHIYMQDSPLPLLPLLEVLASSDESLVRDQAIISLKEIASYLPDYQIIHSFISTLFKLCSSKNFQSRISACKLFSTAYPRSGSFKDKLRNKLIEFCQDENSLIRRSAAEELINLVELLEKPQISNEIFHIVQKLLQDEQEEIRVIVIEFIKKFCILFNKDEVKAMVFPLLTALQEDPAWKVRSSFAKEFGNIVKNCDKEYLEGGFLQILLKLLHDNENEVRVGILKSIGKVVESLGFEKILNIFPIISGIVKDESANVRTKIAGLACLSDFWRVSESEYCGKFIFPIFEAIVTDGSRELKNEALKNFHIFSSMGSEFIQSKVLPLLKLSFSDQRSWRMRKKVLKIIRSYTQSLGSSLFTEVLSSLYLDYLRDPVCEVREIGYREFKKIVFLIEADWISSHLSPKLNDMFLNTSFYLHKISILKLLSIIPGDFLGIFNLASKDSLSNIRITVCKAISQMLSDKKDCGLYYSIISELKKDKDREVAYQASTLQIDL